MITKPEEMRLILASIINDFPNVHTADIPGIDLYMDQVTTFLQDKLQAFTRRPEDDKLLTKTMINNYVKNKVLIPPVKKKYSRDHMMFLIMIYYLKSFLSIGDIRTIMTPIMDRCSSAIAADKGHEKKREPADKKREHRESRNPRSEPETGQSACKDSCDNLTISHIYDSIIDDIEEELPRIHREISDDMTRAAASFPDAPEEEREILQQFSLICRLSAEVYIRKLFIEKLLDQNSPQ